MPHFICVTCGTQFAETTLTPDACPICLDPRQYVAHCGQKWITLEELQESCHNTIVEEEADLDSIHTQPKTGIGQRAFLVHTTEGNLLWDCVPLLDDATIATVKELGGIAGIAISHPHYYTTMVEWSLAFGGVPIHLHRHDAQWVMRPHPTIQFWDGDTTALFGGLTLVNTSGHFDGFQVLHWPAGAGGKGVLLSGDQPFVCADRKWVSFMYSYPNLIPLGSTAIQRIVERLRPHAFDRIYGAFPQQVVTSDAKGTIVRSTERYLTMIGR